MNAPLQRFYTASRQSDHRHTAMVEFLRGMVIAREGITERCHAIFLDERRAFLGDTALGQGADSTLSLRMRDLFGRALSMNARGILIAHNHPSGHCRPSRCDISSTMRIRSVAETLDMQLIDHLIFTRDAVYSMRAGGNL